MWFKKSHKNTDMHPGELPELPDLPDFPEIMRSGIKQEFEPKLPPPNARENLPALPSLPNSEIANRYGQEAIKAELGSEKIAFKPYTKEISPEQKEVVREEKRRVVEIYPQQEKAEPVFVRIDRFQNSLKNFQEIRKQLIDIEAYLSEIRDIRTREDAELSEWEKELHEIKTKLENIDSVLFKKLE